MGETRALLRRKHCFYGAIFAEIMSKFLVRNKEKVSTKRQNLYSRVSLQEQKSVKSVRERSALQKTDWSGIQSEFSFAMDQFRHVMNCHAVVDSCSRICAIDVSDHLLFPTFYTNVDHNNTTEEKRR